MSLEEKKEMLKDYAFMTEEERTEVHKNPYEDANFTDALQMGYIALNSIEALENIAEHLIGTVEGVELDGVLEQFHDWTWNEQVWKKFYTTFNDDNEFHCENSFFNNHFETLNELKKGNERWIEELLKHHSIKEIVEKMPEARFFMTIEQIMSAFA